MTRRRLAGIALVVSWLASCAFAAPSLPDCAHRCVTVAATVQCDIDHFACVCQHNSTQVITCIGSICPGGAGTDSVTAFRNACTQEGVAIPGAPSTSNPPPSNSASSVPSSSPTTTTRPPVSSTGAPTRSSSSDLVNTPSQSQSAPGTTAPNPQSPGQTSSSDGSPPNQKPSDSGGPSTGSLVGAILGGLIGGLIVVGIVLFILWRRRRRLYIEDDDDGVHAYPVSPSSRGVSYGDAKGDPMNDRAVLLDDMSSQKGTNTGSALSSNYHPLSGGGLPPGAAVPYIRGAPSVADSQGTLAARPLFLDTSGQNYNPRKGDPPPEPSLRGTTSPVAESAIDSATTFLQQSHADLTREQLDIVQAMVNRRVPGVTVVDVIQRMLQDNSDIPPSYAPPNLNAAPSSSGSGSRYPDSAFGN